MSLKNKSKCLLVAFGLFFSSMVMSAAVDEFEKGMQLFRAGNYAAAVKYFEAAKKQGLNKVSLYYNLGSGYYKLGYYDKARYYFSVVRKSPRMRDLAEYNLGLTAMKMNEKSVAHQHFTTVVSISKDKKLLAMSRKQLALLEKQSKPWLAYLSMNLGYDDNITASPGGTAQDVADNFYDLFVSVDRLVSGYRGQGWLVDASYFRIDFFDDDLYDDSQLGFGVRNEKSVAAWELRSHLGFNKRSYANDDFQSTVKLDLQARHDFERARRMYLRYIYEDIKSDNVLYDYLQGWRQRVRAEYREYRRDHIARLYYELELNDREDLDITGFSASYSPTRHTLRGKYTFVLDAQKSITADLSFRSSDYPETVSLDRQDDRWRFALEADYRLDRNTRIRGKLQYISNDSSVEIYDYDKSIISLGITHLF